MGILLAHEFGHLIAMRRAGLEASIFFRHLFRALWVEKDNGSAGRLCCANELLYGR